jgi:hypothetical protein
MSADAAAAKDEPNPFSLANFGEILFPCLEAISPRSVVEIGAYRGDFTRELLDWAGTAGARVTAIDPYPQPEMRRLTEQHPELQLVEEESHAALSELPLADAIVIDGDHNHYTVNKELRLISQKAGRGPLPLLFLHDVCWPHARRDTYYAPERIPEDHRQPLARDAEVAPGEPGLASDGLPYPWAAMREGGPKNGVLTAVEDFMSSDPQLRLAIVPIYFGLGVLWSELAPWAETVAKLVEPWDASPMLRRVEAERIAQIVDQVRLRRQLLAQEEVLRKLLDSRAFALAERLSNLKQRGRPIFSREQVRRVLEP